MKGEYKGKPWFVRFGVLGSPDIICVVKVQFVGTEVKALKGKQSGNQKEYQLGVISSPVHLMS
jgi:hypothetical protein